MDDLGDGPTKQALLPVVAGKNDKSMTPVRFATIKEAEDWIAEREKVDPEGVHAGDYYIDAPEEMVNPPTEQEEAEYSITPLGTLINTGFKMAEAMMPFPDFDELREEWGKNFDKFMLWSKQQAGLTDEEGDE